MGIGSEVRLLRLDEREESDEGSEQEQQGEKMAISELARLQIGREVVDGSWSADGTKLAVSDAGGNVNVWLCTLTGEWSLAE